MSIQQSLNKPYLPSWDFNGKDITSIEDFGSKPHGFVYLLTFNDKKLYCGKKNLFYEREIDKLKNGQKRIGHVKFVHHNRDGHRIEREIVRVQSDWLTYTGSCKETEGYSIENRIILELASSQRQLTYLEVKWLFKLEAIENEQFLNSNIGGRFFRGNLA